MKIGFTTSLPVEVLLAAGHTPIDMNNIFVTGNANKYVEDAEFDGYPRNICSWIKGMYGVAMKNKLDAIIGVVEGDCSNTHSLMETLQDQDLNVIPFSFPHNRDRSALEKQISILEEHFGVSRAQTIEMKRRLDIIRKKLITLDELTWKENKVSGLENHLWLVNSSDFEGNPDSYEKRLDEFLKEAAERKPLNPEFKLAFLGVPPIITDLYEHLLESGVNVIFNEVQRQFAMPNLADDIVDQYMIYTYPYNIFHRLEDIKKQLAIRNVDGIISYSQSFCHRQIDNILIKKHLNYPILVVEGDAPGPLDARSKLRIESFLDMLRY